MSIFVIIILQLTCDSGSIMPFLITWSCVLLILLITASLFTIIGGTSNKDFNNLAKRV